MRIRPHTLWFLVLRSVLVLLVMNTFAGSFSVAQVNSQQDQKKQSRKKKKPYIRPSGPPSCPAAGLLPMQPSEQTSHHKVTLSWNAPAQSGDPGSRVVGYCLYRSKTEAITVDKPTCSVCEQINLAPVADISCVDDVVEDGATYYYVVTAITSAYTTSPASDKVKVVVPAANTASPAQPNATPPLLCRKPAPTK